ncbi:FtsX-like permease family protein [Shewanella sp. SHSM-M6]|uniref:FtsX-like permease family protein n=2 Tax=Shewanella salipaludis TaxID=2723052 RepID=A0A972JJD8_9GAMM|nr:FtsX-like permease family protein [Shewanella salipaludis]
MDQSPGQARQPPREPKLLQSSRQCLRVFLAHYRQVPLQAGAILLGLVLAVSLLTGVRAINDNAIRSYAEATELLSRRAGYNLLPAGGNQTLDENLYFRLRRSGLSRALAVLQGRVLDGRGELRELNGSDLVAAMALRGSQGGQQAPGYLLARDKRLPLARLLAGEPLVLMSQSQASRHAQDGTVELAGVTLTVVAVDDALGLGSAWLTDISLAQRLLKQVGRLSYIALFYDELDEIRPHLAQASGVRLLKQDKGQELTALTRSFHLNLQAMSLLAFVVGLFIAYNGVRYSLMKRQRLLVQLLQLGIERHALLLALLGELFLLVLLGASLGFILGLQLSQALQPMVASTLEQLYGARLMPGHWQWQWLAQGVALTFCASFLACVPLYLHLIGQPLARSAGRELQLSTALVRHRHQLWLALGLFCLVALLLPFSRTFEHGLLLMGLLAIAIPLALPSALQLATARLSALAPPGLWRYILAETRQLVAPLSLAMMAMLLALSANIAMNTLVGSFEHTLRQWLDVRLHADLYLRPDVGELTGLEAYLRRDPEVRTIYKQWRVTGQYLGAPVSLVSRDPASLRHMNLFKERLPDFWAGFEAGELLMISEPMAIKHGLKPGDSLPLTDMNAGVRSDARAGLRIGAVFYDYGDPIGEVIMSHGLWQRLGLSDLPGSLALSYAGDATELALRLQNELHFPAAAIFGRDEIKRRAMALFSRTFSITSALNSLTLLVAAIGLFSACLMLTQSRQPQLACLSALGVSRRQLRLAVLLQMLLIVLLTGLLALPSGAALGYLLLDKVTPQAFGWSIPMKWDWQAAGRMLAVALAVSALAVALPLYWQTRRPLIHSLQQETR